MDPANRWQAADSRVGTWDIQAFLSEIQEEGWRNGINWEDFRRDQIQADKMRESAFCLTHGIAKCRGPAESCANAGHHDQQGLPPVLCFVPSSDSAECNGVCVGLLLNLASAGQRLQDHTSLSAVCLCLIFA